MYIGKVCIPVRGTLFFVVCYLRARFHLYTLRGTCTAYRKKVMVHDDT